MIQIETARLLQAQSRFGDARGHLDKAATLPDLTPEQRNRIAGMLAQQGDFAAAIKTLEASRQSLDESTRLLLADLYRRTHRVADAEKVYTQLLNSDSPGVATIESAAAFYAT